MTKYYLNGELVRTSKRNDFNYIVTIDYNNCGKPSLHVTLEAATKAAAKTRNLYEKEIKEWAYKYDTTTIEYQQRIENCKVFKLEKVSA